MLDTEASLESCSYTKKQKQKKKRSSPRMIFWTSLVTAVSSKDTILLLSRNAFQNLAVFVPHLPPKVCQDLHYMYTPDPLLSDSKDGHYKSFTGIQWDNQSRLEKFSSGGISRLYIYICTLYMWGCQLKILRWAALLMCTLDHSTATIQWKNGITPLVTPQSVFTVFTVGMTVLVILNLRTIVFMKSAKTMEKKNPIQK